MFSKLFGRKKNDVEGDLSTAVYADFSFLKTDIHSHLIPGIDDGAQTIEDSLTLINEFRSLGYLGIVTTPHIKSDYFPNTPEINNGGLKRLHDALSERSINFSVRAAAEYYVDERFIEMLESGPLLTIRNNELLIEFSFMFEPMNLHDILFKIQTKGYKPIIAHPERYNYYHQKPQVLRELRERGCLLQLNTIALTGYYGKGVKDLAERLLQDGLYDYCGSDMHHLRHAEALRKITQTKSFATLSNYPFLNKNISF
jgi:tyrosine-protein phosphatase YwqE